MTFSDCIFSKGRHNSWGYVPEREIARLFEPAVKAVTLDEEINRVVAGRRKYPKYKRPFDIIAEGPSRFASACWAILYYTEQPRKALKKTACRFTPEAAPLIATLPPEIKKLVIDTLLEKPHTGSELTGEL